MFFIKKTKTVNYNQNQLKFSKFLFLISLNIFMSLLSVPGKNPCTTILDEKFFFVKRLEGNFGR